MTSPCIGAVAAARAQGQQRWRECRPEPQPAATLQPRAFLLCSTLAQFIKQYDDGVNNMFVRSCAITTHWQQLGPLAQDGTA